MSSLNKPRFVAHQLNLRDKKLDLLDPTIQNKWTFDRLMQTPIRGIKIENVPNERYYNIVTELVKPEYISKLLKWISTMSEPNKKGLRVIKVVIDQKAQRRFKSYNFGPKEIAIGDLDLENCDASDAAQTFRKIHQKTNYENNFGAGPKSKEEYKIDNESFKHVASQILLPEPAQYIDKWINRVNNQEEFSKRILMTLREIYTVIKKQDASISTNSALLQPKPALKDSNPPRFDKLDSFLREKQRAMSVQREKILGSGILQVKRHSQVVEPDYKMPKFDPIIVPQELTQVQLKGDLKIVRYLPSQDNFYTHNRGQFVGKQIAEDNKAKIVDQFQVSCGGQGAFPDPQKSTFTKRKFSCFVGDTRNIGNKLFQTNAFSQLGSPSRKFSVNLTDTGGLNSPIPQSSTPKLSYI